MLRPIYSHISFPHNRDWLLCRLRIRFARTYYYMLQTSSSYLPVAQDPNCAATLNLSILLFSFHSLSLLVGMVLKLYIVRRTTTEYYFRITHYIHFSKWESSTRSSPCFFEHFFCIIGLHNVTISGHDCLQEKIYNDHYWETRTHCLLPRCRVVAIRSCTWNLCALQAEALGEISVSGPFNPRMNFKQPSEDYNIRIPQSISHSSPPYRHPCFPHWDRLGWR